MKSTPESVLPYGRHGSHIMQPELGLWYHATQPPPAEQALLKHGRIEILDHKLLLKDHLAAASAVRCSNKTCGRQIKVKRRPHWWRTSSNSRAEHSDTIYEEEKQEDISRQTLIWRAIKLPIYSVALIPLTIGSAAAYFLTDLFSTGRYLVLLASSVLIITWLNLSRSRTLIAAYLLLDLGFMGLTWASVEAGSMRSMLLLASAITCGYIYQDHRWQTGILVEPFYVPLRNSYQGLGEPLCFAAFGPFATTAFYLSQTSGSTLPITGTILSASFLVGFTTTIILFCSHFHRINEDRPVGKLSPLVRLSTKTSLEIVKLAVIAFYSLLFAFGLSRALPFTSIFLCALTLPAGKLVVSFVGENHKDKTKIFMAKYFCVRLHAIFGAAFAAGLVAARLITKRVVAGSL